MPLPRLIRFRRPVRWHVQWIESGSLFERDVWAFSGACAKRRVGTSFAHSKRVRAVIVGGDRDARRPGAAGRYIPLR